MSMMVMVIVMRGTHGWYGGRHMGWHQWQQKGKGWQLLVSSGSKAKYKAILCVENLCATQRSTEKLQQSGTV